MQHTFTFNIFIATDEINLFIYLGDDYLDSLVKQKAAQRKTFFTTTTCSTTSNNQNQDTQHQHQEVGKQFDCNILVPRVPKSMDKVFHDLVGLHRSSPLSFTNNCRPAAKRQDVQRSTHAYIRSDQGIHLGG